jgi:hypothetical protein
MGINRDDEANTGAGRATGAESEKQTADNGHQPQQRNQPRGRIGMSSLSERIQRPMKRNQMGEMLAEFDRAVTAIFGDSMATYGTEFKVLALDAGRHGLHYSAVMLIGLVNVGGRKVASTYTMILEGSASQPRPTVLNMYGKSVEVVLTAMDAWDELTWAKVQAVVKQSYGDGIEVMNAGASVVPQDIDVKDEERVWQIVWAAQEAVLSTMESSFPEQFEHFNLAEIFDSSRDRMNASFTYNGPDGESVNGLPVRSDMTLVMSSSERNAASQQNQLSSFQHQTAKDLLEVNSYVDLVYAPSNQAPAPGQMPPTQIFVPRVTITKISALDAPFTPETFLLGLATNVLIGDNYAWAAQFANFAQEEIHDIGGIGYRLKNPNDPNAQPQPVDTKTNTFGQNELFDLIQTTCWKDPAFSMDCEDVGPESWLTGAFVDSASGNANSTNFLIAAANNLTNGNFGQMWQGGHIAVTENNRVHLGTYVDGAGQTRDLREIDSLAILNHHGHNDMSAVNAWESTFNDMQAPIELRLEKRLQMIRNLAGGNLKIRGFAERITFTPEFIETLVAAVVRAGLMVDEDGLQSMYGQNYQVGNSFLNAYATHAGSSGMVNTGGPQGNHLFRRPMSRWQS